MKSLKDLTVMVRFITSSTSALGFMLVTFFTAVTEYLIKNIIKEGEFIWRFASLRVSSFRGGHSSRTGGRLLTSHSEREEGMWDSAHVVFLFSVELEPVL